MSKYWVLVGQTVFGGNTGYTETEMLGFIAQQQVLANTFVNVDRAGWIVANQVPALQQALNHPYYTDAEVAALYRQQQEERQREEEEETPSRVLCKGREILPSKGIGMIKPGNTV